MALKEEIPKILAHLNEYADFLQFNLRLYRVFEGQVKEEVEKALREEIISQAALNRALKRIPSVNIVRKSTDKLSKVYVDGAVRRTNTESDQNLMDEIVKGSSFNSTMAVANTFYNLHNMCAIEPFVDQGVQKFRVLAGHQFLPYSNDPTNPMRMTVFIKLLGREHRTLEIKYDENGREVTKEEIREVDVFALYSDDEFMIIDSTGSIRQDKMNEMGHPSTVNDFGKIPFIYLSKSALQLIPFPNQQGFDISILIPKLLTDLNYAAQFMSHSILWSKNADLSGQSMDPDAVVNLGDSSEDGEPEIGTIDPKVDIEKILQLVQFELGAYLSSIGIKSGSVGSMMPGREASGFSKLMDESDATDERKMQTDIFRSAEQQTWDLMQTVQNVWSENSLVTNSKKFSNTFSKSFSIKFGEMKVFKSDAQKLEEIKQHRELSLMSRRQALHTLHPHLTDEQLNKWEEELDKESEKAFEDMMMAPGPFTSKDENDQQDKIDQGEAQRKEEAGV